MLVKKCLWLITFLLCCTVPAPAQKTAFRIKDLYRLRGVSDPQFSPDAGRIAFTVSTSNLQAGKSSSDIYVVNTDGSGLRPVTNHEAGDSAPHWSSDGQNLFFLTTRNKGAQAWALPMQGGDPRQLTHISSGIGDPIWRGNNDIYFTTMVYPDCGTDDACNNKTSEAAENGPVQAHLADRLWVRHWDTWSEGRRQHIMKYDLAANRITDLTPGTIDWPTLQTGGHTGFDVSPDGKTVCVSVNTDSNFYENTDADLWLIPTAGGQAVNITGDNPAFDASPQYAPDGRLIAYLMQKVPGYESDRMRLAVHNPASGRGRVLTETLDYNVRQFQWSPDGSQIFFTADLQGHVPLFSVDLATQTVQKLLDAGTIHSFAVSPDARQIAYTRSSVGEPVELWLTDRDGKPGRQLTSFNQAVCDSVDIRPAEEMWISSPTGKSIHTFVIKPHDFDSRNKYPLILNVHGGPQMQWSDGFRGDWQVYPGAGYVVAFCNPHGSTGYGQAFTRAISKDYAGKVVQDIMAVTDALAQLPYVDSDRMGAMGWSYGGYMMMWLEGHTQRFKAIAAMMGIYNLTSFYGSTEELWFPHYDLDGSPWNSKLYEKWSPHKSATNFRTPCLVITGQQDFRVSYTQSLEYFTALQKMGVPSRLIVFKNDGHWPHPVKSMPLYYDAHLDWFHKYLGGEPAPYDVEKLVRNQAFAP